MLWEELNSESNKLQDITSEDTLVHRDKDLLHLQSEMSDEGEDVVILDEDEIEDLDDVEYIDDIDDFVGG